MEDMEVLNDLKKLIKKELKKNVDKGTLSPPEIDAVHKAVDALEKIAKTELACKELEAMEKAEKNPDMYSGAFYNIRNFPQMYPPNMSYGWNERAMYPDNMSGGRDWHESMGMHTDNVSGARGRNATTGRYVSRDNYSGHSINDRMVDALERMMDTANSEFERQQILDKIKMIRNSPDRVG